jgi:hypothetical protein
VIEEELSATAARGPGMSSPDKLTIAPGEAGEQAGATEARHVLGGAAGSEQVGAALAARWGHVKPASRHGAMVAA